MPVEQIVLRKNQQKGELKGLQSKLSELQLIDGDMIKVEMGTPHEEDAFEVHVHLVTLVKEHVSDETLFTKEFLQSFKIAPTATTVGALKQKLLEAYNSTTQGEKLE